MVLLSVVGLWHGENQPQLMKQRHPQDTANKIMQEAKSCEPGRCRGCFERQTAPGWDVDRPDQRWSNGTSKVWEGQNPTSQEQPNALHTTTTTHTQAGFKSAQSAVVARVKMMERTPIRPLRKFSAHHGRAAAGRSSCSPFQPPSRPHETKTLSPHTNAGTRTNVAPFMHLPPCAMLLVVSVLHLTASRDPFPLLQLWIG